MSRYTRRTVWISLLLILIAISAAACNLTGAPEQQLALTNVPTNTPPPSRTPIPTSGVPTALPITPLIPPTSIAVLPPTSVSLPPTLNPFPQSTPLPISIVILSPIPGNVVAGNIQILGAAIHPQFLQYQLEFGPDPNPGNLWYPATGIVQTPVLNGLLGIWNTTVVQDSIYQLRLRVTLRDGTSLATIVNNVRIQNQLPTPIPSATPNIPRPIAAFTQDRTGGQAPLVVRFLNQSSGQINNYYWTFGDGSSSTDPNPTYTFRRPGIFNVTLTVSGPGGSSNVTRQLNVQSLSAPVAAFTQDKTSGPSPLTIKFTNQSTGQITSYSWSFGDGQVSTEASPTVTLSTVGTYNVILSVTGPGGTSFVTRKITVEDPVVPPPVASFTSNPTTGDAPLSVQFTNQSTGQITSYAWDFGDGQTSVEQNPVHIFSNPGTFIVRLTAIGSGGQNTAQANITITKAPDAPTAVISANPTSGDAPLNIQFSSQSTGQITSYAWDFGDGQTSSEQNPSHTFTSAGTYTVKLTVTGPGGSNTAETTVNATQPIVAPSAAFTAAPVAGTTPLTVLFTNQSTGDNLTYSWDFGDSAGSSTDTNPSYTFATPGNYTVKLTTSNSAGTDQAEQLISVSAPAVAPVASFTANPTTGTAPFAVQFTSTSTGDISSFLWNFGDGVGSSSDPNPAYTFNAPGDFTVSLTVSGPGGSNTTQQLISVSAPAVAPVASFTANPTTGTAPLAVQFTSTSTGDISSFLWNFGDGVGSSSDPNPAYTFNTSGDFTVSLTVSGPGGSNTTQQLISVSAPAVAPVASFTANPTTGTAPFAVQFTSTSTGDISSFLWNFGDGVGSSSDPNPAYTFNAPGDFTVSLTVSGPGGSNTTQQLISVSAPAVAPVASFTANPTTGTAPLAVQFTSTSTGDISSFLWNFGDGVGSSSDPNPAYTFNTSGDFTVSLTVSGPGGSNTNQQLISVSAPAVAPVASFTANPTTGTAPLAVQFSSTSTGDISSFLWNFGDGVGSSSDPNPAYTFNAPGDFTVSLTVSGPGGSNTTQQLISVSAPAVAPVASFTANPTTGTAPLAVQFSSTSTGDISSFLWNFGDGVGSSSDPNPAYTFNTSGDFTVSLTVSGPGGSNTTQQLISVSAPAVAPVASFTANPTTGTAPLAVQFSSTSTGDISSFLWNFGDGVGSSSDPNPAYTFNAPGDFTVSLTVSGPGGSNTTQQLISVSAPDISTKPAIISGTVLFTSNRDGNLEIYSRTTDGQITRLTNDGANDTSPAWSSDGRIAFVSDREGRPQIYIMNADGSAVQRISDLSANDTSPAWSSDGRIAFVSDREGRPQIYIMNADGSAVQRISDLSANDTSPAWSSDGRIAFVSDREGRPQIYIMNADGSAVQRISDLNGDDNKPSWSPDGGRIVFASTRDGRQQIYVMNSNGTDIIRISDLSADDDTPVWSPDGSQILFVSSRDGSPQIYVMNTDGSGILRVSDGSAADVGPTWRP